ncbi:unnamed protein product, partial [Discosporangium mesarthrocarpum]
VPAAIKDTRNRPCRYPRAKTVIDVLAVAIRPSRTPTLRLQETCLALCREARSVMPFHVTITDTTLHNLRCGDSMLEEDSTPPTTDNETTVGTKQQDNILSPRITRLTWARDAVEGLSAILASKCRIFGLSPATNYDLDGGLLVELDLGGRFNKDVSAVRWPQGLLRLALHGLFDQPVCSVVWPVDLEEPSTNTFSTFGNTTEGSRRNFLPPAPQILALGDRFNHPLKPGFLPRTLREVPLGWDFDRILEGGACGRVILRGEQQPAAPAPAAPAGGGAGGTSETKAARGGRGGWPPGLRRLSFRGRFNRT